MQEGFNCNTEEIVITRQLNVLERVQNISEKVLIVAANFRDPTFFSLEYISAEHFLKQTTSSLRSLPFSNRHFHLHTCTHFMFRGW